MLEKPKVLEKLNQDTKKTYKLKEPEEDNSYYYLWLCQSKMNQTGGSQEVQALQSTLGDDTFLKEYEKKYKDWYAKYPRQIPSDTTSEIFLTQVSKPSSP